MISKVLWVEIYFRQRIHLTPTIFSTDHILPEALKAKDFFVSSIFELDEKSSKFKLKTMDLEKNLSVDCVEEIFRHLDFDDLMTCTLVSPHWNNIIGASRSCMEKIKLDCRNRYDNLVYIKRSLMDSKRRYAGLQLEGDYSKRLRRIFSQRRTWTHIYARCLSFETVNHFLDFLRIFQSSIQVLVLQNVMIAGNSEPLATASDFQFP